MSEQSRSAKLLQLRQRLQKRRAAKWLACVAVFDAKLGLNHCERAAIHDGEDYNSVCLLRSLMRHLHVHGANKNMNMTVVLMVLHDVHGPTDRYLQAVFTADEMRHHMATQPVLHDVHMQREIEAKLDTVPYGHVIVVHIAAVTQLGPEKCQMYRLSQPHHRWNDAPIVYFEQCWFSRMSRIIVCDN